MKVTSVKTKTLISTTQTPPNDIDSLIAAFVRTLNNEVYVTTLLSATEITGPAFQIVAMIIYTS